MEQNVMIRKVAESDREIFTSMVDEFYHSPAVLHAIPLKNIQNTFDQRCKHSPFADAYLFECDGNPAGYALLAITYSNEAGGPVLWIEEVYILPAFQGRGIGSTFFRFLEETLAPNFARVRLEVEQDNQGAIQLYKKLNFEVLDYLQMYREIQVP